MTYLYTALIVVGVTLAIPVVYGFCQGIYESFKTGKRPKFKVFWE